MKIKKALLAVAVFSATLASSLLLDNGQAFAAVKTWTGGGGDTNFSTSGNWSPSGAPVDGDSIDLPLATIFGECADRSLVYDLNSSINLSGLSITGEKPTDCYSSFTINSVDNNNMSTINIEGTFSTTIRVGTYLNINLTDDLDVEGRIDLYGNLSIGAHNITVLDFSRFYGSISGSGSYISDISSNKGGAGGGCTASSNYPFPVDSSTFTGSIVLSGDMSFMVIASGNSFFGRHASSITVNDEARIGFVTPYGQDATFDIGPITMNGGGLYVAQDLDSDCDSNDQKTEATLNSSITFLKNTDIALSNVNLNLKQATGRQYIKLIEGQSGHVIVDGETVVSQLAVYDVTDAENCSYLYNANYINNKVVVGLDCAADDYFPGKDKDYPVGVRGILAGTGKVGYVLVRSGGVVAPGMSPGTLTVLGIEWLEGGIYEFEIGANGSDLIVSEGDVKLGNGTLSVLRFEDYVPAAGTVYTIIQNDSANPVDGTFLNLPEGATFETADGGVYRVSYVGGDGNDVTLTVITTPTVPNTGLGMIRNNPMVALVASIISALTILVVQRRLATRSK